mgnify:CR=1 FL=1
MASKTRTAAKWLAACVALLLLAAAIALASAWWWLQRPLTLSAAAVELSIEPGTTPREVAQGWVASGVRTSPQLLYQWFRWSGQARRIRAGSYQIGSGTTPRQLLDKMVQGDETLERLRLAEGWTWRQVRSALAAAPNLKPATQGMTEAELMHALGDAGTSVEGRLFPDTYLYSRGVSDLTVLKRAHAAMRRQLDAAWAQRGADSPLRSADQALILASIVEKESGPKDDAAMIATVFLNRLRLGMPLQSDPTVIYGLGEAFDGNLRKRDLQADAAFNTYTRAGLPPTPIGLPSAASLQAVVKPRPGKALYFVARGDGSSAFSDTLAEHNRAVNTYQRKAQP